MTEARPSLRMVLVAVPLLGLTSLAVGVARPPAVNLTALGDSLAPVTAVGWLTRIVLTACVTVSVVLGPGLVLRQRVRSAVLQNFAFVWVPGVVILAVTGLAAWLLAYRIEPAATSGVVLAAVLLWLAWSVWRANNSVSWFRPAEAGVCGLVVLVLAVGTAKATWSPGPENELFGGSVSRTLESSDRSDSRISYHIVQLIAHGSEAHGGTSDYYFAPYSFSDRGPISGLASAPIVLSSGADPPLSTRGDEAWVPFDPQGFAAYRIVMELFGATVLLSVFGLLRLLVSSRVAWAGTVLVAGTPFVLHEVYFTWPKLLAASFGVAALVALIARRPLIGGALLGLSYLAHPVGLFISLAVGATWLVLALWGPSRRWLPPVVARVRASLPRVLLSGSLIAVGVVGALLVWRAVNADDYRQSENFMHYLFDANEMRPVEVSQWVASRLRSVGNTLVPFELFIWDHDERHVNPYGDPVGPLIVPFFFQYWNTVPFGVGLVYFPVFLLGLWRFGRRIPSVFFAAVVLPFLVFAVYWGSFVTGLMREGLQGWVVLALITAFLGHSVLSGAGERSLSRVVRACVTLRGFEVLAMLIVPTVVTTGWFGRRPFALTDLVSLAVMVGGIATLAAITWRAFDPARLFARSAIARPLVRR